MYSGTVFLTHCSFFQPTLYNRAMNSTRNETIQECARCQGKGKGKRGFVAPRHAFSIDLTVLHVHSAFIR